MKPKPPVLTGTCEGCGSPDGLWQPHNECLYCPRCAFNQDEWDAARAHLASLLGPVIVLWYRHWRARNMKAGMLVDMTENGDEVRDAVAALASYENPKAEAAADKMGWLVAA